ncbi:carbohydrate ABC transporter permease [Halobacteriales archaeon QS_4_62_28]|nr:MAG: carbohydrate ABC transporter permease [Halobacteriales archaeon QS_4_62_28]
MSPEADTRHVLERFQEWRQRIDKRRAGLYIGLAVLAFVYLLPFEAGIMTALKSQSGYLTSSPLAPPLDSFTLGPWTEAWSALSGSFMNSLGFAVPAAILSAVLGSIAAHGLTNIDWKYQNLLFLLFVAGIFLPYQSVLVPLTRFWNAVDLHAILANLGPINVWTLPYMRDHYATILELIFTHTAYGIPIATLLFRSFYQELSTEMVEAARIDGATPTSVYTNIILPLSKPIFIVVFIYQFTSIWNGLLISLIVAGVGPAAPITVEVNKLAIAGEIPTYNTMMAGAFITAIPTLLIYIFFGDRFAQGVRGYG